MAAENYHKTPMVVVMDTARLTDGATAPAATIPVRTDRINVDANGLYTGQNELVGASRPTILRVNRDRDGTTGALDGSIAVWGANLPNPEMGQPLGNAYATTAAQTVQRLQAIAAQVNFDTDFDFVDFSNYNWIVTVAGAAAPETIREVLASAGTATGTQCKTVTNAGKLRITFATAPGAGQIVTVYKVTPVEIMADGAHPFERVVILGKSVLWVVKTYATNNLSKTQVTVEPAMHG